jgi:hypothetical protein
MDCRIPHCIKEEKIRKKSEHGRVIEVSKAKKKRPNEEERKDGENEKKKKKD